MRHISIEVSDYEFVVLNEELEGAKEYYTRIVNESNYSNVLIMTEDQARELKDLLICYILDEEVVRGCSTYEIIKEIYDNVYEEIEWLPYIYDEEDFEDDEY